MHSAAMVGLDGTIDWLCFPDFDSPSVFASLLDHERGGHFAIGPASSQDAPSPHFARKQLYWPETNVLVTRFLSEAGVVEIEDFMPAGHEADHDGRHLLVRRLRATSGRVRVRVECHPAFDYGRAAHATHVGRGGAVFEAGETALALVTDVPLSRDARGVHAELELAAGDVRTFVLRPATSGLGDPLPADDVEALFRGTVAFWHAWLSRCTYRGRWRETVHRSALALKLLTHQPTGAIVAAATTSLPERIGGDRNWDYRYAWLRDAAFTVYGLLRIGFTEEAAAFMEWLEARCREARWEGSPLGVAYALDGRRDLEEHTLAHLEGYRGSAPVRIGNGAHDQLQLDVYGELLDAVYLHNKYGSPVGYDTWVHLQRLVDWVAASWRQPDEGIWEVRSGRQDFVYSKLMCWVALDRGLRLAEKRSFPVDRDAWRGARDDIYRLIMERGYDADRGAFVQTLGGKELDAGTLVMPLVFFVSPSDPRMLKTLDAIRRPLEHGGLGVDGLVYRYDPARSEDGVGGEEGAFNMCSFWLVEALTRAGRVHPNLLTEARHRFQQLLGYANHLGLYAEQTGRRGEALGNFPQAFTHLSLISAAFNLDRALDGAVGLDPGLGTR